MTATNKTTTGENPAGPLTGAELVRIVQSGDNFKTTTGAIAGLFTLPTTTKGDLIVNDGTSNVRFAAGTDGYVLSCNSTVTGGLQYIAPGVSSASLASSANGLGVDLVGGSGRVVNTIAALKALLKTGVGRAFVLGYYAAGDGGGGEYWYDSTSSSTDNGGSIIVASDGGRWKLIYTMGVSIKQFGAKVDGSTDDTTRLQAAITYCRLQSGVQVKLYWNTGTTKVTGLLTLGSNQYIEFEQGAIVDATGLPNETTSLFAASGQSVVVLIGNGATLNGARADANPVIEGNSAAFFMYGSDNVVIRDFNIVGFATDGITLTGDNSTAGPCTNVRIEGCDSYNNRRNGMSIIHAVGVTVIGGRYWGSTGAPSGPWAGIDIEPNANNFAQDINLIGVRTQNNKGAGIQITPGAMSSSTGQVMDVTITGGRSTNDSTAASSGTIAKAALLFTNGGTLTNEVYGQIVVNGFVVDSPSAMGVNFQNWDSSNAPRVILENVQVINPNYASGSTGNQNQAGFTINCDSTQAITNMGKITMRRCKAIDTRVTPVMVVGAYLTADSGKTVTDVLIQDFVAVNYLATAKTPVNTPTVGALVDCTVTYTTPKPVGVTGSQSMLAWCGQRMNWTTSGATASLPSAALFKGAYFEAQCDQGAGGNTTVARIGSDTIKANGVAGATTFVLQPGDVARFRSEGGTVWSVCPAP